MRADDLPDQRRPVGRRAIEYKIPDMYGRPWAEIWEEYFQQGMDRPKPKEDIFTFK